MQFHLSFLLHGSAGRSITPTCPDADENASVVDRVGGANSLQSATLVHESPKQEVLSADLPVED